MSPEWPDNDCDAVRDELLRLTYGDIAAPSAALQAHRAACASCRELAADTDVLLAELRSTLRPEPLRASVAEDILARVDARLAARPLPRAMRLTRLAGIAVAAGVLAALLIPGQDAPTSATSAPVLALSPDDAATIVAAFADLRWNSPLDSSAEYLAEQIDEVAGTAGWDAGVRGDLPWEPEDDWDVPAGDAGTSDIWTEPVTVASRASGRASDRERTPRTHRRNVNAV